MWSQSLIGKHDEDKRENVDELETQAKGEACTESERLGPDWSDKLPKCFIKPPEGKFSKDFGTGFHK